MSSARVGCAAAEVVFAVGTDSEVGGVAVDADLAAEFQGVLTLRDGEVLLALEEIAVDAVMTEPPAELKASYKPSLNLTAGSVRLGVGNGGVERVTLKVDVDGDGRGDVTGEGEDQVALAVDIVHAEGGSIAV